MLHLPPALVGLILIVVNAGFLATPQNVLAVSGDPYIDIQCRFDSDVDSRHWLKGNEVIANSTYTKWKNTKYQTIGKQEKVIEK